MSNRSIIYFPFFDTNLQLCFSRKFAFCPKQNYPNKLLCRTLYDDFCVWLRAGDRELECADLDNQLSEYLREQLGSPIFPPHILGGLIPKPIFELCQLNQWVDFILFKIQIRTTLCFYLNVRHVQISILTSQFFRCCQSSTIQPMVNWWFGFVVWIPDIPLRKGLGFLGVPRFENAPNHPFTSIHHSLNHDSFVRKYLSASG